MKSGKQSNRLDESVHESEYLQREVQDGHCVDHGLAFSGYCETCEECVCEACTIYGPHNDDSHWLQTLDQAFESRSLKLGFLLHNKLDQFKKDLAGKI